MRFATLVAVAGLMTAAPLAAQDMPESYKEVQLRALEAERRMFLAMADTMPERLYRDKATPAQRDFAGQVLHHPNALPFLLRFVGATNPPALPDTAAMYNTRAGMKLAINTMYDWAATVLRNHTPAHRAGTVDMFGTRVPGWQVWDELHMHAYWTAGQIVANFRKHGMAPPGFFFY